MNLSETLGSNDVVSTPVDQDNIVPKTPEFAADIIKLYLHIIASEKTQLTLEKIENCRAKLSSALDPKVALQPRVKELIQKIVSAVKLRIVNIPGKDKPHLELALDSVSLRQAWIALKAEGVISVGDSSTRPQQ